MALLFPDIAGFSLSNQTVGNILEKVTIATQAAASLSPGWNKFGSQRGFGRTRVADRSGGTFDLEALRHYHPDLMP
jgi:hypothetical protein